MKTYDIKDIRHFDNLKQKCKHMENIQVKTQTKTCSYIQLTTIDGHWNNKSCNSLTFDLNEKYKLAKMAVVILVVKVRGPSISNDFRFRINNLVGETTRQRDNETKRQRDNGVARQGARARWPVLGGAL